MWLPFWQPLSQIVRLTLKYEINIADLLYFAVPSLKFVRNKLLKNCSIKGQYCRNDALIVIFIRIKESWKIASLHFGNRVTNKLITYIMCKIWKKYRKSVSWRPSLKITVIGKG